MIKIGNKTIDADLEVILEELKVNRPLTDSELKAIELSFIYAFRPKYNEEGLTRKYNLDASQL